MPNWCSNNLHIIAPNKNKLTIVCKKLGLKNEIPQVNFGSIVPEPRDLEEDEDTVMPGWYNWRVSNWGTKWDVGDINELDITYDEIAGQSSGWTTYPRVRVQFVTAWSPPTPFTMALSEKYPDCVILLEFEEGGVGYEGELLVKGGEVEYEAERDMKPDFDYLVGDLIGKEE